MPPAAASFANFVSAIEFMGAPGMVDLELWLVWPWLLSSGGYIPLL
jgi:hypothetical protein